MCVQKIVGDRSGHIDKAIKILQFIKSNKIDTIFHYLLLDSYFSHLIWATSWP